MCINYESRENVIALGSTSIWRFPPEITKTTDKKCVVFRDYSTVRVGQKQMRFLASNVMPESLFSYAVWKRCLEVFPNCWHWQYAVMLDLKISVTNTPSLRMYITVQNLHSSCVCYLAGQCTGMPKSLSDVGVMWCQADKWLSLVGTKFLYCDWLSSAACV